jgi:hypothetical protein
VLLQIAENEFSTADVSHHDAMKALPAGVT